MRLILWFLLLLTGGQYTVPQHTAAKAPPVNCGEAVSAGGSSQSGLNNLDILSPCTTGADANGYTVVSEQVYIGTASGTLYGAVYNNTTVGCGASLTNCAAGAAICKDTTGFTPSSNQFNTDNLTGCGTLSANTIYWVGQNNNNASMQTWYQSSTCPDSIYTIYYNDTAGNWTSLVAAGANATTKCYVAYLILQPK